jgi:hypothetical protein
MSIQWKRIYSDSNVQRIHLLCNVLIDQGIDAQVINKQDSAYPVIGEGELYVDGNKHIQALQIIKPYLEGENNLTDEE